MPLDPKMTYTDIVIDLETWSLRPTAAIRSIGAVAFDITDTNNAEHQTFYQNTVDIYGHYDPNTEQWWSEQSEDAQKVFAKDKVLLLNGLNRLFDFMHQWSIFKTVRVWSNGAAFDLPIIRHACTHYSKEIPWNYKNERDTRTLYWLAGKSDIEWSGVKHYALDDAIHESKKLRKAYSIVSQCQYSVGR